MKNALLSRSQMASVAPKNRIAEDNRIGSVGTVSTGSVMPSSTPFVDLISFTLDNAAGASAKNYVLFDASGACASLKGGTWNQADTTNGVSVSVVKESTKQNPLIFTGFGYRITTGTTAQFNNAPIFAKAAIDQTYIQRPIKLEKAIRNNQFQDKILHINQEMTVDHLTAIFVTVAAGTTVAIDFWVGGQMNVL